MVQRWDGLVLKLTVIVLFLLSGTMEEYMRDIELKMELGLSISYHLDIREVGFHLPLTIVELVFQYKDTM